MDRINPSTFRRRITAKNPITLQDAGGGIGTTNYDDLYTTWASVEELSTNRLAYYGMDLFNTVWEIKLRFVLGRTFTTGTVIGYDDKTLIVKDAKLIKQDYKAFYILLCIQAEDET